MKKTFDVIYPSHKYSETWVLTKLFCPNCGHVEVWANEGIGDYYVGSQHICVSCGSNFYLPNGVDKSNDEQDKQRLQNLLKE